MSLEETNKVLDLHAMRDAILVAKYYSEKCGFGGEVQDAFNELKDFAEFELDEMGADYS